MQNIPQVQRGTPQLPGTDLKATGPCKTTGINVNLVPLYLDTCFDYAVEKAPSTKGWSNPVFDELWNYGSPHEMRHFARCVRGKETSQCTGEDGRVVMEGLYPG